MITPWRQLKWDDFRGQPPARLGPAAAQISTALTLEAVDFDTREETPGWWISEPETICLFAAMNKLRSSRLPGTKDEMSLRHEQLHFDLTEVAARRLYPRLLELSGEGDSRQRAEADLYAKIRRLHAAAVREQDELQRSYDRETDHGRATLMQRRWNRKVGKWLAQHPAIE